MGLELFWNTDKNNHVQKLHGWCRTADAQALVEKLPWARVPGSFR